MTANINDALRALQKAFPDGFATCINFDIIELGYLTLDSEGARIGEGNATTVIRANVDTFADIVSGNTDPAALFFSGRLKVEGDLGVAIRLGQEL